MKKTLLAAAIMTLASGSAFAATMTVKYEHKLLDGRTDRPKLELSHRMDNGLQLGFENAWQIERSETERERKAGYQPDQYEMTFKTDYQHRWGDRREWQLGTVLDFQLKEEAKNLRYGVYAGYRYTRDLQSKVRVRVSENIARMKDNSSCSEVSGDGVRGGCDSDTYNKELRVDHWLTYQWSDFTFVWDFIYLNKLVDEDVSVFDNNKSSAIENEFSAEYRLPNARAHSFYGKYKIKQELKKSSHKSENNGGYDWFGKRDNAIEVGYKYRF
ncbi:hypothetical protein A6E01_20220 (plasmid) [Vibrio breoganii]|uniref:Porin n=1 Tax=Vibrio breoganii TaxID=553239 RepID=A0AAN1CUE2_9VIBR|nr:oligogalacturonate-specific porin KdgM family protein [Vibrio breoganii]ANO35540.1 hypothetical protein A6E01_20220 [Vibrio breoganii]PML13846.1 hypothetical protein BCT84_12715 [Vibrio breoganii]